MVPLQYHRADDPSLYYSDNFVLSERGVTTNNPGAYCKFKFSGSRVRINIVVGRGKVQSQFPLVSLSVDGSQCVFRNGSVVEVCLLAESAHLIEHEALLVYEGRADLDEDVWGCGGVPESSITIVSVGIGQDCRLSSASRRRLLIDVDGNSIVEGFATRARASGFASEGFALNLGAHLEAEVSVRGWSANGFSGGGRGNAQGWGQMLLENWSLQPRHFPDDLAALIVFEADNEGLVGLQTLEDIVSKNIEVALGKTKPCTQIILCGPFVSTAILLGLPGNSVSDLAAAIQRAVARTKSPRLHYIAVDDLYDQKQTLDNVHPNAYQSMNVIAPSLAERITPILQAAFAPAASRNEYLGDLLGDGFGPARQIK